MLDIPITLERIEKLAEDDNVILEIEAAVSAQGGKLVGVENTLTELLFNGETEASTLKELLDNA